MTWNSIITPLRIARGILGTALTWSVPWGIAGALLRIIAPTEEGPFPSLTMLGWSAIDLGVRGAIMGAFFAMLIAAGGRRRFATMTVSAMALLGAVASLLIPAAVLSSMRFNVPSQLATYIVGQALIYGALGASCAAGTLLLLRRPHHAVIQPGPSSTLNVPAAPPRLTAKRET
jgi:hypothetical protein